MGSDCCTATCVCRLGYPENRRVRTGTDEFTGTMVYWMAPRQTDIEAGVLWGFGPDKTNIDGQPNHACDWEGPLDCVAHHYPGGWPAFIKEVVEK